MKQKPTPPQPAWSPVEDHNTTPSQPVASPLRIEDHSPFAEPLAPPVIGSNNAVGSVLCDTCERCWTMSVAGQFKNKRSDGSEFLLTERFCVFKDSLVTLAERSVRECSRYIPKSTTTTVDN